MGQIYFFEGIDYGQRSRYNSGKMTNAIDVGCAIIEKQGRLLIAQRPPGVRMSGYWEFPGGKREDKEKLETCLVREVYEELGVRIRPRHYLGWKTSEYRDRNFRLHFYLCDYVSGTPVRHGCLNFAWAGPHELRRFRFVPADTEVINDLIAKQGLYFTKPWTS